MNGLEKIASFYGQYYDHFEAQNYSNNFLNGSRATYREKNRRKFIKYCLHEGLPSECYKNLVRSYTLAGEKE